MSETKHATEPWEQATLGDFVFNERGAVVFPPPAVIGRSAEEVRETMRRIAACVNACAGIPSEELERLGAGGLLRALNGLAVIDAAALLRRLP